MHIFYLYIFFVVGCSIHLVFSDGRFGQVYACCTYQSTEKEDCEYEIKEIFNKEIMIQYNSTRGNWTGFTENGLVWARGFNNNPRDAEVRKHEKVYFCLDNRDAVESNNLTAAPTLKLTSVKQSSGTEPALLLCSAYNFYPKEIEMTWLQNGQKVTSAVTSTEVLSDGDLYYQIHSYLEHSPKSGEEISCMVEHVSLPEPLVQVWDPHHSRPWSDRVKIGVGTFFLVLGLVVLSIGFIRYKINTVAPCMHNQGCELAPVEVVFEDEET